MNSYPKKEKSKLLAGIQPKPLHNLSWANLFLIWQKCEKEEFCKKGNGKKLKDLLRELKNLGYFDDFIDS